MTLSDTHSESREADWKPADHGPHASVGGGARGAARIGEYARLRESKPVAWAQEWGGYWTLTRYSDVKAAAKNHGALINGRPFIQMPDISDTTPIIPIALNPPEHPIYRRAMNKYFIPERMDEVESVFRVQIGRLLDQVIGRDAVEVVGEFCHPAAARGLAILLNLPEDASQDLIDEFTLMTELRKNESDQYGQDPDREGEARDRFFKVTYEHVLALVQERRERPLDPEKDIFSGLIAMTIDDEPLSDQAIAGIGAAVLGAGHQTTKDAISGALFILAANAGDQARLRRDPSLIPGAVEEFLRLDPPTQENVRRAVGDVELHGRTIRNGEYVALNFASANRDAAVFENPDACIIDRSPNRHMSFGFGLHQCLGSPLARMEIRVALEEVLARTSMFELAGAPVATRETEFGGLAELPIRFSPAREQI